MKPQESLHIHLGPVGNGFRLRVVGGTLDAKAAALAARPLELARPEFPASRYCAEADVIYEPMDPHPQAANSPSSLGLKAESFSGWEGME